MLCSLEPGVDTRHYRDETSSTTALKAGMKRRIDSKRAIDHDDHDDLEEATGQFETHGNVRRNDTFVLCTSLVRACGDDVVML